MQPWFEPAPADTLSIDMSPESVRVPSLFLLAGNQQSVKERYSNETLLIDKCDVGLGVFAKRCIRRGEVILTFEGPLIDFAQAKGRGPWECMTLQVGSNTYLDPLPPGVLVNHSCEPNAGVRDDRNLMALRDIPIGEEVRYDYSTTMEEKSFTMQCRCGAAGCRGVVDDFSTLPRHIQERYLALGIVMSFIVRQFSPVRDQRGREGAGGLGEKLTIAGLSERTHAAR